jgi:hypothetical protein
MRRHHNPDTIASACPTIDVFGIVQRLVDLGLLESFGAGSIRVADVAPPANAGSKLGPTSTDEVPPMNGRAVVDELPSTATAWLRRRM